jgi:hypothetical protein
MTAAPPTGPTSVRVGARGGPPLALAAVDAFEFDEVAHKFMDYYDVEAHEARAFFAETKRWLWLAATSAYERERGLPAPDLLINGSLFWLDEMWHTFILFTAPYQDFCEQHLGRYVHHRPTTQREKLERREQLMREPDDYVKARADELRRQCHYICEKLGEPTVVRWYREFAQRYSATVLADKVRRRQPAF